MLELRKRLKESTDAESIKSLANYYFVNEEYEIALLLYYKCFVIADSLYMLIEIERRLEKYNQVDVSNEAEVDILREKVVKSIYDVVEQEWSKYEKGIEVEYRNINGDLYYFLYREHKALAWKIFQLRFFQELKFGCDNFIEEVYTMALFSKKCKSFFKKTLQKERDEFIHQQKSHLIEKLSNENNWLTVQSDDFWFDDILEVFHDNLGWLNLTKRIVDLEVKRCRKYSVGFNLYELGILIGQKGYGDQRALNLIMEGLSTLDKTSQYWFFKSGVYNSLTDLRDAFECLSSKSQEALFKFIMSFEDIVLKIPIYIEIYPVLKSVKIKEIIRQPMIEGEKNPKKISMVLEPSLELDKIIDYAIQEAKRDKNINWIMLLVHRLEDKYPSYDKLKDLNLIYNELQEERS